MTFTIHIPEAVLGCAAGVLLMGVLWFLYLCVTEPVDFDD